MGIHSAVAKIIATSTLATYILGFNIFFAKYYVNVSNTFLGVLVSNDFMIFYSAKNKIKNTKKSRQKTSARVFFNEISQKQWYICQSINFQEKFAKGTGTTVLL